jgi:aminopeptidase N
MKKSFTRFRLILLTIIMLAAIHTKADITPGDTIHAIHYVIDLQEVNMANQTIDANSTITLTPLVDNLTVLQLQLMDLTVDSIYVDQQIVSGFTHDNEILHIPLATPVSVGDTLIVQVFYHGEPFHEDWGGFHYSGDYAFNLGVGISWIPHNLGKTWFPCIDDFTDRATYEVMATVPENMTAVAGGELLEVSNNGNGTRTFHWYLDNPIPTYLASVAIGDYTLVEDTYAGVERDIPITYYVLQNDSILVSGSFSRIHEITALYEEKFGPYDWHRIGYVGTALGAMEHATNIAYPHFCINGNNGYEDLYAHELSHMWFGDKVTCDKAEEMWINEGWATFCQHYYVEILDGEQAFKNNMRSMHAAVLKSCHNQENGYHPLNYIPQEYTYGTSAYDKGATVVQALRAYLGDDVFFSACESYLEDLAYTSVSSYDMEANFTANTGIDMSGFFNNWVYHGGTPHYSIDSFNYIPSGSNYDVTVYLKQRRHGPAFVGNGNRIGFNVTDANWVDYPGIAQFDGPTGSATITIPEEPAEVFLDLYSDYMDATIDITETIVEPGEYSFSNTQFSMEIIELSDPAFIQVTHNFAPPDTFSTPVPDLRLSDYRYWTIKGVLPETFTATGRFSYNRSGFDNTLILNQTDSLVIFYREDAGMEWQPVEFTSVGPWTIGYLYVENMQMGDYTLGVYDLSVGTEEAGIEKESDDDMTIFPNPSKDIFNIKIENEQAEQLIIYTLEGKVVRDFFLADSTSLQWNPANLPYGTYVAVLKQLNGKIISTKKIVFMK